VCSFSFGPTLERWFNSSLLYINYDFPVEGIPTGVLSVPVLGLLGPVAWALGAEVLAGEVDARFVDSLQKVRAVMQGMYPDAKLSGEVRCKGVDTPWPRGGAKSCLLYSGGVDSTTSIIRNLGPNLTLASIRGTPDLRLWEGEFWDRVEGKLKPFVQGLGLERHIIETNALDVVNFTNLNQKMKPVFARGWWEHLSHGLILLSLCAPLTYAKGIQKMIIASSYHQGNPEPWGSTPESDEKVAWGEVTTVHDSFDLQRLEKIKGVLAPYITQHPGTVKLRACTGRRSERLASGTLNCGVCQKCARTSLGLMWAGIDPAECGFPPPDFAKFKAGLISGTLMTAQAVSLRAIKASRNPPDKALAARYPDYPGFLAWFYDWTIPKGAKGRGALATLAPAGSRRRRVLSAMFR